MEQTSHILLYLSVSLSICLHVCACMLSRGGLFATPWTPLAPLSMEFSREGHYSGLPFSPPEGLPDPGLETLSPTSPALTGGSFFFFF